jgi:cell division protein FtsZ
MENEKIFQFDYPTVKPSIIKVIGVGGGGGNAVTHMYHEGIHDVTFVLCNTDNQALLNSEVPLKVQLGKQLTEGLGAGNKPEIAQQAAEESAGDLHKLLDDGTKMLFITAGMGGGTGTGAAPVIAKIAKDMNILTVAIVTIPFLFEGKPKILQALNGVEEISKHVDALLVVNNERLREIYRDLTVDNAFRKADDTLTIAAKSIAEIITLPGIINLDFADVNTTLKNGGVAIMSSGQASGENRLTEAINNALSSPLLNNNDIFRAKKILLNIVYGDPLPLKMNEMDSFNEFMSKFDKEKIQVIWGTAKDDNLGEDVRIIILATGFGIEDIPSIKDKHTQDEQIDAEARIKRQEEMEAKAKEESELLGKYYPMERNGMKRHCYYILSDDQLDDDSIIELLADNPPCNRKPQEIEKLIADTIARRKKE